MHEPPAEALRHLVPGGARRRATTRGAARRSRGSSRPRSTGPVRAPGAGCRYPCGSPSPSGWSTRSPSTRPCSTQPADRDVGGVEHRAVLDAHADQVVDVEEAAVAEVPRRPPEREPVVLRLEELVHPVGVGGHRSELGVDVLGHLRLDRAGRRAARRAPAARRRAMRRHRSRSARGCAPTRCRRSSSSAAATGASSAPSDAGSTGNGRSSTRTVMPLLDAGSAVALDADPAGLEHPSVVVVEHREHDHGRAGGARGGRSPTSKVPACSLSSPLRSTSHHHGLVAWSVAMWLGTMSTTSPIPRCAARRREAVERGVAADRRVDVARVDDVVAVGRSGRRGEHRREVEVADARVRRRGPASRRRPRRRARGRRAVGRGRWRWVVTTAPVSTTTASGATTMRHERT